MRVSHFALGLLGLLFPGLVWAEDLEIIDDPEFQLAFEGQESRPVPKPETFSAPPGQSVNLMGRWASRSLVDVVFSDGEDVFEHYGDFDLILDAELSPEIRVLMEAEFRHWTGVSQTQDTRVSAEARLGEAYVTYRGTAWAFRAGNLVTRWGATDLTRPSDVINPVDFTVLNASALPRVPQPALEASVGSAGWRVSGVLVPFFVPNRTWVFGRDTATWSASNPATGMLPLDRVLDRIFDPSIQDDVQGAFQATRVPDETPENVSAGFRASTTMANTDLSLGWFYGWDRTPSVGFDPEFQGLVQTIASDEQFLIDLNFAELISRNPELIGQLTRLSENLRAGNKLFEIYHDRLLTMSADAARYVGPIGVRADFVFQPERTFVRRDLQTERKPTLSGALGFSWESFESENDILALNLEFFAVEPLSGEDYLITGRRSYGAAAMLAWTLPSPALQIQLAGTWIASAEDLIAAPSIQWKASDWLNLRVFAMIFESFGGNTISNAVILDQNDLIGFELNGTL